jgi:hypothetical protein
MVLLIMWKADVAAVYRQMPMHPFWQIFQIISAFNERHVDHCNNFGGCTSQKIWASFISLVLWIAVFKHNIRALKCYVDNNYSFTKQGDVTYYFKSFSHWTLQATPYVLAVLLLLLKLALLLS